MLRSFVASTLAAAFLLAGASTVRAVDDPRFAAEFVQGLRERGLHDLALEYLDQLRQATDTPADLRKLLEYEEGRTLIEAAAQANDPDASKEKLEKAKGKIEAFVKANPDLPQTTEALVDLAHLLYERGRAEVSDSGDARTPAEKDTRLAGARVYYGQARESYNRAFERLGVKLASYPRNMARDDPRLPDRERIRGSLMQAELQRSVVDYDEAQTYPPGSQERNEILDKGLTAFNDIHNRYRTQMAGFSARMWQAKCYEEQGKLGEAMGIYNELMDHPAPELRRLQKQVEYFRIIVMGKRKEFALGADECVKWLAAFPKDRRSYEALGVQLELARDIIEQLPGATGADRDKALRKATDALTDVVRVVSPFKPEALALLRKYRPNAAINLNDIAKLNYEDAMAQAEQAISTLEYEKAIALFKVAIRKAEPARDPVKVNRARFTMAFCYYMTKHYAEAAVIDEHLARRYPSFEWSAKAADIAISSLIDGYSDVKTGGDRGADLDHLVSLARYTADTWPEAEQGDTGRMTLGLVAIGRGRYPEAIRSFDTVRAGSSRWIDAQAAGGDAHWKLGATLREKGDEKGFEAETTRAISKYGDALKARKDANTPESDPSLIANACDLATIHMETSKPAEALALLEPIARKLASPSRPSNLNAAYARVVAGILRAHVSTGKVDLAIADMKTLETAGGAGNGAAQLYFELGRLLEREIEALRKRNDRAGLARTEDAYQKFLKALVASKSGQSFQSLQWAGENLLKLDATREAGEVFGRILDQYSHDAEFLKTPNAADRLLRVRIKQVAALRGEKKYSEAEARLAEIIDQNKRLLEPQMEKGYLLEARAESRDATWVQAYAYWKALATRLATMSPKPVEYYDAWYHAAYALQKQGKADLARQTAASVMRLSPAVGNPEMKAKYQALIKQTGK